MSATNTTHPPPHHTLGSFDVPLFDYVISQVLFYEPSTAVPLLQVSSRFHQAAAKCLYEELYIHDDDAAVHAPPRNTRLEAALRYSQRYAGLVRTLVLVPAPLALQAGELCNSSSFVIDFPASSQPIRPESLNHLFKSLPQIEAFVWATDRMPFHSICSVLHNSAPHLIELLIRPTISDLAHSRHRLASQDTTSYGTGPAPQRWDGFLMLNLASLRTLYISGLSIDGIRELQKLLQRATRLAVLTIDSQFVDDALLMQVAELKCLQKLLIKSSGTKMTDKGVLAVLESCEMLQSLAMTEVEGRLQRSFWSKVVTLPCNFDTLSLAFSEEEPHHSWVADHLSSVFDILALSAGGMKTFSITRLTPKGEVIPVSHNTQDGMVLNNGNGIPSGQEVMLKRVFTASCDEAIRPRLFPDRALPRIIDFGFNLERLELDMFVMSIAELKSVVESCKKLRILRILLDAPLTKVLTMSSAFVSLTQLHTLVLSITDAHCPNQALIVKAPSNGKGQAATTTPPHASSSPFTRRPSDIASTSGSVPDLSPASTHASLAQSDPEPLSPSSSPRRSVAVARRSSVGMTSSIALQNLTMNAKTGFDDVAGVSMGIQGSVGSFDTSVPPKRDIRKFARRCPSLRVLRWTGRSGKGEWRIAAGSSSIHAHIDFTPIHLVEDEELELITLSTGADVEDFIKRKRAASLPHPGKRTFIEETEQGLLALKITDKETETTPRVDGRQFPRLKVSTSQGYHVKEATTEASAKETMVKKKESVSEEAKQATISKARPAAPVTSAPAPKTPKKAVKSYADISDPTQAKKESDIVIKTETKMTVLGESNRKKTGSGWTAGTPPAATNGTNPGKQRTVTKMRGNDDTFSGATIIIGQGKGPGSTNGAAAARRGSRKGTTATKQPEEAVATTSTAEPPSSKKNKGHAKKRF